MSETKTIDIHHHYVPMQVIEEARRHGEVLGVGVTEERGRYALSFAGSKPHRLQPPIFDTEGHLKVMDQGQVEVALLEANTNSLGYRLSGEQGEAWAKLYTSARASLSKTILRASSARPRCRSRIRAAPPEHSNTQ